MPKIYSSRQKSMDSFNSIQTSLTSGVCPFMLDASMQTQPLIWIIPSWTLIFFLVSFLSLVINIFQKLLFVLLPSLSSEFFLEFSFSSFSDPNPPEIHIHLRYNTHWVTYIHFWFSWPSNQNNFEQKKDSLQLSFELSFFFSFWLGF